MSHIAERVAVLMAGLYSNASISFSEGLATFAEELRSVQPTFFFAVPRLWMKFKEGVDAKIPPAAQAGLTPEQRSGIIYQLGLGSAKFVATGSAPLSPDIQDWYLNMGIVLRDAYGVTENFIHGTGWLKDDKPLSGCVGQPLTKNVNVRISDEGEIQFKSKGVMKGYYNKTSKGKFIVPSKLENMFGRCDKLAQFCVFGLGAPQPMIFTTLSESGMKVDADDDLKSELSDLLSAINSEVPTHERLSTLFVTPPWTMENELLTPTMKMKRKQIEAYYKDQVSNHNGEDNVVMLK